MLNVHTNLAGTPWLFMLTSPMSWIVLEENFYFYLHADVHTKLVGTPWLSTFTYVHKVRITFLLNNFGQALWTTLLLCTAEQYCWTVIIQIYQPSLKHTPDDIPSAQSYLQQVNQPTWQFPSSSSADQRHSLDVPVQEDCTEQLKSRKSRSLHTARHVT